MRRNERVKLLLISVAILVLDSFLKISVTGGEKVVHNTGVAFGLFGGLEWRYVNGLAFVVGLAYYFRIARGGYERLGGAVFLGGAASNFSDRLLDGDVIDYLTLQGMGMFNVADLAIATGLCIIFAAEYARHRDNLPG